MGSAQMLEPQSPGRETLDDEQVAEQGGGVEDEAEQDRVPADEQRGAR